MACQKDPVYLSRVCILLHGSWNVCSTGAGLKIRVTAARSGICRYDHKTKGLTIIAWTLESCFLSHGSKSSGAWEDQSGGRYLIYLLGRWIGYMHWQMRHACFPLGGHKCSKIGFIISLFIGPNEAQDWDHSPSSDRVSSELEEEDRTELVLILVNRSPPLWSKTDFGFDQSPDLKPRDPSTTSKKLASRSRLSKTHDQGLWDWDNILDHRARCRLDELGFKPPEPEYR